MGLGVILGPAPACAAPQWLECSDGKGWKLLFMFDEAARVAAWVKDGISRTVELREISKVRINAGYFVWQAPFDFDSAIKGQAQPSIRRLVDVSIDIERLTGVFSYSEVELDKNAALAQRSGRCEVTTAPKPKF